MDARASLRSRTWRIRPLAPADEAMVVSLLEAAALPTTDLDTAGLARFLVAEDAGTVAGVAGIEPAGPVALLRSVAVGDTHRRRGLGRALVRAAENQAWRAGIREIYLLTTTAAAFFGSLGYGMTPRDRVPPGVAASAEFARLCPASAACMHKALQHETSEGAWADE